MVVRSMSQAFSYWNRSFHSGQIRCFISVPALTLRHGCESGTEVFSIQALGVRMQTRRNIYRYIYIYIGKKRLPQVAFVYHTHYKTHTHNADTTHKKT